MLEYIILEQFKFKFHGILYNSRNLLSEFYSFDVYKACNQGAYPTY